jgi:sulfur-oxidizing protein SoxZ
MKVKAKLKGDVVNVKVLAKTPSLGAEEAEKKKKDVDYISTVVAKANGKVVYEMTGSGFMSKNPLFKFKVKGLKAGDEIEVTTTTSKGESKSKKAKVK